VLFSTFEKSGAKQLWATFGKSGGNFEPILALPFIKVVLAQPFLKVEVLWCGLEPQTLSS